MFCVVLLIHEFVLVEDVVNDYILTSELQLGTQRMSRNRGGGKVRTSDKDENQTCNRDRKRNRCIKSK